MSVSAAASFIPQGAADFAAFRFDTYTVWEVFGLLEPAAGVEPATF
jgi:hypothetical protein